MQNAGLCEVFVSMDDTWGFKLFSLAILFFVVYGFGSFLFDLGSLIWK
jgi:hypothetical protein